MNTLRLTKCVKVVLTSLLVLLAICSLIIGARWRGSRLTSKADYIEQYTYYYSTVKNPSDWVQDNNYIIKSSFVPSPPNSEYYQYESVVFNGEVDDNSALLYSIIAYSSDGSKVFESGYYPANTSILVSPSRVASSPYRFYVYVKRADGEPLSKNDMRSAALFRATIVVTQIIDEPVQTTAIPSDWLDNTTQTYQTVTTATKPEDYDTLVGTVPVLTPDEGGIPPTWFDQYNPINKPWFVDILSSLTDWFDVVTVVSGQMKIFWVFGGFVVIGLLLAWLLH